jgi:eukaryotic-like serine/threonine-protein kinase
VTSGREPVQWQRPQPGSDGATLAWVNALVSGQCSAEIFSEAMRRQCEGDPEGRWEILSLLDQYYRRGKIKPELFRTLKSRLEDSALRPEQNATPGPRPAALPTPTMPVTAPPQTPSAPPPPVAREVRDVRDVNVGDVLRGRYRVQGVLGHGGMGTVYEAIDEYRLDLPSVGQRLAIKVLHTAVSQREELLSELRREFQHLQLLSHPNIVRVYEFDRDGDIAFFTMELLSGSLLSRVLSARGADALPRPYALAIIRDAGAALCHAHSRGVVHGDINPQNIFITSDGELRVLDFGASHKFRGEISNSTIQVLPRAPVATPGYASCELLEGQNPDARDDIFAFACVAYLLLSGHHPFPRRTAIEARTQNLRPTRPSGLTGQQWRVLRDGLRWDRDRRPADVDRWLKRFDLTAAAPHLPPLSALLTAPPPRKSTLMQTTVAVMALAALGAGGYWAVTNQDSLQRDVKLWSAEAQSALAKLSSEPAAPTPTPPSATTTPRASTSPAQRSSAARLPPAASTSAPSPATPLARQVAANPAPSPSAVPATSPARARAAAAMAAAAKKAAIRAGIAGPIRVEMAADTVEVFATDLAAHVTVRRRGNIHGDASFSWWTESGTAKPGRDFVPVTPHVEHIGDGHESVTLTISLSSARRTQPQSFYVVIDQTESGPVMGARTLTMVTLQPPD